MLTVFATVVVYSASSHAVNRAYDNAADVDGSGQRQRCCRCGTVLGLPCAPRQVYGSAALRGRRDVTDSGRHLRHRRRRSTKANSRFARPQRLRSCCRAISPPLVELSRTCEPRLILTHSTRPTLTRVVSLSNAFAPPLSPGLTTRLRSSTSEPLDSSSASY